MANFEQISDCSCVFMVDIEQVNDGLVYRA